MEQKLDLQTTYRAILDAARDHRYISYGDLARANGATWSEVRFELYGQLGDLMQVAAKLEWPIPSSIVVNQANVATGTLEGKAREGFISAARELGFNVDDPDGFVKEQQERMFEWALDASDEIELPEKQPGRGFDANGPKFVQYFGPLLDALRALGGAAEPRSAMDKVVELAGITEQELGESTKSGQSRHENQVGWARFYLCRAGLIDGKVRGRWALTAEGSATYLDQKAALALFRDVHSRFGDTSADEDHPAPDPLQDASAELFGDSKRSFWFVGATWDREDQTERFLREGIWTNGYDQKFADRVQRMKPGDLIAIKSTFTQKYGLPFENRDRSVSCMRIKAIGTVTEGTQDGQTVRVEWRPLADPKDWYFYTYWVTIVGATGRSGLVLDTVVEKGNPADSARCLPMLERHIEHYGTAPTHAAFDGGTASRENLKQAKALGVTHAMFHKKRGMKETDMSPSPWVYRQLKRFRAGIEAGISYLKRCFGLGLCRWRGWPRFQAYVHSAVFAHNLMRLVRPPPRPA